MGDIVKVYEIPELEIEKLRVNDIVTDDEEDMLSWG